MVILAYLTITTHTFHVADSPLSRLTVHRLLKRIVQTGAQDDPTLLVRDVLPNIQRMVALGEHGPMTERRADEASRDVGQWLNVSLCEKTG